MDDTLRGRRAARDDGGRDGEDAFAAAPGGRHVRASGLRLYVCERGERKAPVAVLIHGLAAHGGVWRRVVPGLAARGLRVVVPDLPGHGRSDAKRHRGTYTPRFFARVLLTLMDELDVDRFQVVGNSLGGLVAARMALLAPTRVERVALVDSAGLTPVGVPWRTRLLYLPLALPTALGLSPSRLALRWFLEHAVVADGAQAGPLLALLEARPALPVAVRRSALALIGRDGTVAGDLERLTAPTLLVWGERDVQFPPAIADMAARRLPDARVARVAGVGHVPPWEAPEAVTALLGAFLAPPPAATDASTPQTAGPTLAPRRLRPRRPLSGGRARPTPKSPPPS
jgi:pimeloyl-ACP methyl ester carboxylesterase